MRVCVDVVVDVVYKRMLFLFSFKLATGHLNLSQSLDVQMMPKPIYTPDVSYMQNLASIYIVIAFSPFVTFLLILLVTEKEKKIKETMKIMGMQDSVFWYVVS